MKYFENVETLEELKKAYKKLVLKLHPDVNKETDTTEQFKIMQDEYEKAFDRVKNTCRNAEGTIYNKECEETIDEFRDIIDQLIKFEGVEIEIIGTWIWVSGNTKEYKDQLKEIGFRWAPKKCAWSYHKGTYRKQTKKNYTLEELRNSFESSKVQVKRNQVERIGEPA
jgi:curved DNA-binding protein CbpA